MSYTTKHKPYKLKSIKCSGCGWSISHCMDLKKEQLRIKNLKKEVVKEYIHVDNPKCKHCIELEKVEQMKKILFSWFSGMLVILIFCFFIIGVPTLISFIWLPDWVVFAYLFVLASIVFALTGMKD